jgi:hypothetical protein
MLPTGSWQLLGYGAAKPNSEWLHMNGPLHP